MSITPGADADSARPSAGGSHTTSKIELVELQWVDWKAQCPMRGCELLFDGENDIVNHVTSHAYMASESDRTRLLLFQQSVTLLDELPQLIECAKSAMGLSDTGFSTSGKLSPNTSSRRDIWAEQAQAHCHRPPGRRKVTPAPTPSSERIHTGGNIKVISMPIYHRER